MNINRLLSRREKDGGSHHRQKSRDKSADKRTRPISGEGIISLFKSDPQRKLNSEQDTKVGSLGNLPQPPQTVQVESIKQRLQDQGYLDIDNEQITYALLSKHADGDTDRALEMVLLFRESVSGVIKPYNPAIQMRGAENRQGVTCYLDALLFAMFARLGSFEPILYTKFEDEPRRRLSTLIRLWVNMLRTGELIQTDITGYLQDALAACGWKEAALLEQQDTSEAFSFITETLELPLLTLKMDIYHTGAEDASDDHKFIQERLLEVAVPPDPGNGRPIQLEDCLENFFNNRVEVVRRLDRSNTFSSVRSGEKSGSQHVEITDLAWSTDSPSSPTLQEPGSPLTPTLGRPRAGSIIRHRLVREDENGAPLTDSDAGSTQHSARKASIRKEVLMPAWQFFNLIPWYTKGSPSNDAEVAAHFSKTRPVLGICLKRYAMSPEGRATKESTFIDIPLDIRLPHFIEDDMVAEEGPLMGNFKLSLQSVICHRGNSLHSGHYVSFVRAAAEVVDGDSTSTRKLSSSSRPPDYPVDRWVRHDDLSHPDRVQYVDIEQSLKDETPYLLFYQVQPTNTYGISLGIDGESYPPSYDSGVDVKLSESGLLPNSNADSAHSGSATGTGESTPAYRFSSEAERPRRSVNLPEDRLSLSYPDISTAATVISAAVPEIASTPPTPIEETTAQRLSRAASRFARPGSRSRPVSSSGENRISATFSRMRSKDQLSRLDPKLETPKEPVPSTGTFTTTDGASDAHDAILAAVNEASRKPRDGAPDWTRGKLGRKHDKNKESGDKQGKSHSQHLQKGKGKEVPDRECIVM